MSNSKDIAALLNLFSDQYYKQSFETISTLINNLNDKKNFFQIGSALVLFLRSKDIINNNHQILIAYFCLWDIGKSENEPNPYLDLLYGALTTNESRFGEGRCPSLDPIGRTFLASLILQPNNIKELFKKTPYQVYQDMIVQEFDLSNMAKLINDIKNDLPIMLKCGLPCIIPFEDTTLIKNDAFKENTKLSEDNRKNIESILLGNNAPIKRILRPEFIRLQPPLHTSGTMDELIWLQPSHVNLNFIYDLNMDRDNKEDNIISLLKLAKSNPLLPHQTVFLQAQLKDNPDILKKIDFKPTELPDLVEKNPLIAMEALLILFDTKDVASCFTQLLDMDITVHSLEVVNQLTTSVELPPEFIHQYIERCIESCYKSSERPMHRLVRLVCVFIQSLIRNKIIDIKDMQEVITPFCVSFNTVKEACALFKLIRSLNGHTEAE